MRRSVIFVVGMGVWVVGLGMGFWLGRGTLSPPEPEAAGGIGSPSERRQIYTCSMHPQVRLDRPGTCPICQMPLVPADASPASQQDVPRLQFSEHALAMASVETVPVEYRQMHYPLRTVGKIQYDESSLANITPRVNGYAVKLFVNVTGVNIRAGDHLVEVYSPDLLVAEQELLLALERGSSHLLVESAQLKLRNWGLTDKQIEELITTRKITDRVTLYSPITGTVIEKTIVENSAFRAGDVLYRIANLDAVWAYLDIYEFDLPWIRYGQQVELRTESYPGQVFTGMITFVEPILREQTRTIRVPVYIRNPGHLLKPGMYVSAVIRATLGPEGTPAPTGLEGKYTCRMHPHVVQDQTGSCPQCHMPLEQIPGPAVSSPQAAHPASAQADRYFCPMKCEGAKTYDAPGRCPVCQMELEKQEEPEGLLAVPVEAVLDSGTRTLVYVEHSQGTFEPRQVVLGPRCEGYYPVLHGLRAGERVVRRGGFLVDSQFQITGHPSLFYPGGVHATMGHRHDQTGEVPSEATQSNRETSAGSPSPVGHQH